MDDPNPMTATAAPDRMAAAPLAQALRRLVRARLMRDRMRRDRAARASGYRPGRCVISPFGRLAASLARPPRDAQRPRSDQPGSGPLPHSMPAGPSRCASLGLGLAGGGGGSPGRACAMMDAAAGCQGA
ncbi:hypothetical protein B0A89_13165 [Paracoccus contaminans]|uniref:Uncharacterized protein n=1 Tax=Paracoccus contaminans TaxID=1945662 RepID=A0A1W6D051_9RHOB|nr:hypothetical protein B0A89_13165 [Paracoccus contaminans]